MARRQAPPKPEELIASLEEKVDGIKDELTQIIQDVKSENGANLKENIDEVKSKQEQICSQMKEDNEKN